MSAYYKAASQKLEMHSFHNYSILQSFLPHLMTTVIFSSDQKSTCLSLESTPPSNIFLVFKKSLKNNNYLHLLLATGNNFTTILAASVFF